MSWLEKYIAFKTILIKEILRFSRIWVQTILPPAITTALYFIIFGNLIGPRIGDMNGVSYIDFMVPGLIIMSIITNAYANVVSSFFNAKFQRHIEEMLVSPTPHYIIIIGFIAGGVGRGMAVGLTVTLVSMFFGSVHIHSLTVIITMAFMTSILFSLAGLINAVFAKNFDDITIIPTFILTPLTYLGGVFYSIHLLSDFWQKLSLANPILHMVNAFRFGFLGISDVSIVYSYITCIFLILLMYLSCLYLMRIGYGMRT